MYLIGDIGNTETKICLFNDKKKLLKKKVFDTNNFKKINLTDKFKELKSLVYGYKDEKEDEATKLNNDISNLQKELDKINNNYDQLISNTAKEIEEFVERVNLKN